MGKLRFDTYWNDKQKRAFTVLFDQIHTDVGYWGWAWWWKTYLWVSWQWMMRNKYPWTTWFFWRKELKRLKQTTLASYFKFCDDYNIPQQQRGIFNAQDSVINFLNGSKILLLDLAHQPSDPLYTRFGSLELTDWFIDESNEVDEQCITIISTRIWRQKNEDYWLLPKLLQTFNPDKWHVYRKFYKANQDWTIEDYRCFIPALATDNKKIPKSYIEQLMKADEVTKQRLLYGNFNYDDTPWRLFSYDDLINLWTNPLKWWDWYLSIDVARKWRDKTIIYRWEGLDIVEVIQEQVSDINTLSERIKWLARTYWIDRLKIVADEDWVGWGLVDNLKCQWFINNATPKQSKKVNLSTKRNFQNLKTQCYFELARQVKNISIRDESIREKLIEELDVIVQTHLDSDTKISIIPKEDIKEKIWRSPDYSDAMMMRMIYELGKTEEEKEEEKNAYEHEMDEEIFWRDEVVIEFEEDSAY